AVQPIKGEVPEQLVFNKWTANTETRALAHISRFIRIRGEDAGRSLGGNGGERIGCSPFVIAVIEESFAMQGIGATLGDGIDHASGRASIFRGVVRSVDLEFFNGNQRSGVTGTGAAPLFGEECLVIVSAVYSVVVEQGADAAEAQKTEAAAIAH